MKDKESIFYGPVLLSLKWPKTTNPDNSQKSPANHVLQRSNVNALIIEDNPDYLLSATIKVKNTEPSGNEPEQKTISLVSYANAWEYGQLFETWFSII